MVLTSPLPSNLRCSCPQQAINLPVQGLVAEAVDYVLNSIYGQVFPDAKDSA